MYPNKSAIYRALRAQRRVAFNLHQWRRERRLGSTMILIITVWIPSTLHRCGVTKMRLDDEEISEWMASRVADECLQSLEPQQPGYRNIATYLIRNVADIAKLTLTTSDS